MEATATHSSRDKNEGAELLSKRAQKKAARKLEKARRKREAIEELLLESAASDPTASVSSLQRSSLQPHNRGGKAARARAARNGESYIGTSDDHRPIGGAPVAVLPQHETIVVELERLETLARLRARPYMVERKLVHSDNHGSIEAPRLPHRAEVTAGECCLSECNLRAFELPLIPESCLPLASLTRLDLSRNELWGLPDLSGLVNIASLDLSRNWFQTLPGSIATLLRLESVNASHNMLRSSKTSLQLAVLRSLPRLSYLDITFNNKCNKQNLADTLRRELPSVEIKITVNFPRPAGAVVGESPAERDATLLRSQLEPWPTTALRRRLVADFGDEISPLDVPRSDVMGRLLMFYAQEGSVCNGGAGGRVTVKVDGALVDKNIREELLSELRSWSGAAVGGNRERTSIKATNYMILSSPTGLLVNSRKAANAAMKLSAHRALWDL